MDMVWNKMVNGERRDFNNNATKIINEDVSSIFSCTRTQWGKSSFMQLAPYLCLFQLISIIVYLLAKHILSVRIVHSLAFFIRFRIFPVSYN